MRRGVPLIALVISLVVTAGWLPVGRFVSAAAAQDAPTFSATSELVLLQVTVTDRRGRDVNGLPKDAFTVFENKRPQTISFFASQDAAATVGLLIDGSGSMQGNRDLVVAAAMSFLELCNHQDEVFALTFNDEVRAVLPSSTPFTNDPETLREALTRAISARGRTALYDAIAAGLVYSAQGSHPRKTLVIVSDGGDNASRTSFEQTLKSALTSNTVIYTIGLIDEVQGDADPKRLKQLADSTGGEAFRPRDIRQVLTLLPRIAVRIRQSYTIGYVPASRDRRGSFRRIRVSVKAPSGATLVARTRSGYLESP
jgi:VWFA-related protein